MKITLTIEWDDQTDSVTINGPLLAKTICTGILTRAITAVETFQPKKENVGAVIEVPPGWEPLAGENYGRRNSGS